MAKFIMSLGMSHSPMMAVNGKHWASYAIYDEDHPFLVNREGKRVTFHELKAEVGERYQKEAEYDHLVEQYHGMKRAFDRLHEEIKQFNPDVLIVISNDHPGELLDGTNVPALGVFHGEKIVSGKVPFLRYGPEMVEEMGKGMGMDDHHEWPGHPEAANYLIASLMEQNFDVSTMKEFNNLANNRGHGHGFGMVVTELMRDKMIPMVPVYLSAWPPNEISPSRCYDLGRAFRKAIEDMPGDLKVALVASGGLSHFVTDKDLDEYVIEALRNRSEQNLRNLPRHRLKSGNSEIRNWVILAAASEHFDLKWLEYIPVFRTPTGTGIGMAFGRWS
jgi:hypothetical protein